MIRRLGATAGVAALVLVAACSSNPKPTAAAPESASAAQLAAQDAARREQAHRGSMAAKARQDSMAEAQLVLSHADSVKREVMRETVEPSKDVTNLGLSAAAAAMMAEVIHFDYNKADLTGSDVEQLQSKLSILQARPQLVVQIAGNCDERGSDEYNMALGERRASSAKRWLEAHGIAADRITVTSYGKERPIDTGHDEAAWEKNRRDDFVVTRRVG